MTSSLTWLTERLRQFEDRPAILSPSATLAYRDLLDARVDAEALLERDAAGPGSVVLFDAEYTAPSLALFLGLLLRGCIAVPFTRSSVTTREQAMEIAGVTHDYRWHSQTGRMVLQDCRPASPPHPRISGLAREGIGGLIIFTSGSTGTPKASLHRADRFLHKFREAKPALRTLLVLPLDHMAGLDSLLYALTGGGSIVHPGAENPDAIGNAIQVFQAELLPSTPSFLNVLLLSGVFEQYDLSSLRIITYGAEVMPPATLSRLRETLPGCRLIQKYGATEFGSPPTRSREDGSVWFRIHGKGFETRVVDGILWVRSESSMVGYLNADDPFGEDGWINTGDQVETDGDYFRVLGRRSEMINVGGQKVYPADVENVLLQMDNVEDVMVRGEQNPLLGKTIAATLRLREPETLAALRTRVRSHCQGKLPREAVPVRIEIADENLWNSRFKKTRNKES